MAELMKVPMLGLIENYSYLACPDCGRRIEVFGKSHVDAIAAEYHLPVLARLPIDPQIAEKMDRGEAESVDCAQLSEAVRMLLEEN